MSIGQDLEYHSLYDIGNHLVENMMPANTLRDDQRLSLIFGDDLQEFEDGCSQSDDEVANGGQVESSTCHSSEKRKHLTMKTGDNSKMSLRTSAIGPSTAMKIQFRNLNCKSDTMPVGQDLEYHSMYDISNHVVANMMPATSLGDDLLESEDDCSSDEEAGDATDEEEFDVSLFRENEASDDEDWKQLQNLHLRCKKEFEDVSNFFDSDEDLVSPEDIELYLDALEDEIQFNRCVAKVTLDLHGEQKKDARTLLMMKLTLLIEGAPSSFVYNLEKKFMMDVVFQSLKEPNDITMISNAVILLRHLQQNCFTVFVNGNECMEVLYENTKRHVSPKFIEVSLDLVLLGEPDYGVSHPKSFKAIEFCIRIHSLLSNNARKKILCLIAESMKIIHVEPHMVQKFLTKFFKDLPRTNRQQDIEFRDDIISNVRAIYGRLMNNPELVNGITSRDFLEEIYDLMEKEVFGLRDSHQIIETLSIIAVHSDSASQDLIEMGIAEVLFDLYEKFHTSTETHKMDLVTLVWSLMPNLPEKYNINKTMRIDAINNLKFSQWQREVERNVWVPFTPRVNNDIEFCRRRPRKNELQIIESGSICEVFIDRMVHLDHSNDRETNMRCLHQTVYEVLRLKKTKESTSYRLKTDFVHFAFLLVGKRFYTCFHDVERYQCLEALLSLVMNMTREQHDRIISSTKNNGVVETVRNLEGVIHTWKDSDIGLLALQVLAELLEKFPDIYREPCRKEGVQSTVELTFKEHVEKSLATEESAVEQESLREGRDREESPPQKGSSRIDTTQESSPQETPSPEFPTQETRTQQTPIQETFTRESQQWYPRQVNPSRVNLPQVYHPQVYLPYRAHRYQPFIPRVNPPQVNPSPEEPTRADPARVNPRLKKPSQKQNSQTTPEGSTPEDSTKASFRNQAKDLVRNLNLEEAATPVFSNQPRRPKGLCETFRDIKMIFENTDLSLYEIRASGAVPKLLEILTEMKYKADFNNKLRIFLNVFANLPKEKNATVVEIVSAPFERTVGILNDVLKRCFRIRTTWTTNYPLKYIYAAGVRTVAKLSRKTLRISIQSSENNVEVFNDLVYPFTSIQFLESYLMHVMSGYVNYRQWNESIDRRIELYLNGCPLPSHLTVLEAVRHYRRFPRSNVFEYSHVFTYRVKHVGVSCPLTVEHMEPKHNSLEGYFIKGMSLCDEEYYDQALHLLQILYGLNRYWTSLYSSLDHKFIIDTTVFVNPVIDVAVHNTLIDPFNALVQNYPDWMNVIPYSPFLLSLNTRKVAFRVLSLDRYRALRTAMDYYKAYCGALIFDNRYPLIQVDRPHVLDQFREALLHTDSFSIWNVLFSGENGTGVGVKRELYSEVGKELQKEKHKIWVSSTVTNTGYIHSRELYPDFYMGYMECGGVGFENASVEEKFYIIGQIMAKALMEGRLLDLPLSLPVFKWLLKEESQLTLHDLKHVNEELSKTVITIKGLLDEEKRISTDDTLPPETKYKLLKKLNDEWETVESYYLFFVVPNHDVDLIPNGNDIPVTRKNAAKYVERIETFLLHLGVQTGMVALRTGFNTLVKLNSIQIFEPLELQSLICGEEKDKYWTVSHLLEHVYLIDFTIDSHEVKHLFDILSTLSKERRQKFLQYVTGCPRLPADGFAGLTPPLTIKRTTLYPFAQTCFHTLYLTSGMSKEQLETFVDVAITYGVGYFGIV